MDFKTRLQTALEGLMKYDPLSSIAGLKGKLIIGIDTETTGLKSHLPHSQILEVAAIVYDLEKAEEVNAYHKNIKIENLQALADVLRQEKVTKPFYNVKGALKLNKYSKQKNVDPLYESLLGLQQFVSKYPDAIIVMHNAAFDMRFINRYLSTIGTKITNIVFDSEEFAAKFILPAMKKLAESNPEIDTMLKSTHKSRKVKENGQTVVKQFPSYGLQELGKAFGVPPKSAHTAISDVQQMIEIIQKMLNFVNEHTNEMKSVDYKPDIYKWDRRAKKKFSRRPRINKASSGQ